MKKQYKHLSDMKCGDVVYLPYIPVQVIDKKQLDKVQKALNSIEEKTSKKECHTKYGDLKKHTVFGNREAVKEMLTLTEKKDEDKSNYTVLTFDQYKAFGLQRIDESKDCEWQCPTCKHRVKNLQRQKTEEGNPCWGCQKFCDTLDASYFHGKACKLYEEGHSGWVWW